MVHMTMGKLYNLKSKWVSTFKSWLVTCQNVRQCKLLTMHTTSCQKMSTLP